MATAAAIVLVVAGALVAPAVLNGRPMPAGPAPVPSTSPTPAPSPTPTPIPSLTGPARADWYRWSRAPDAPIDPSDYRRAPAAHGVYYVGGAVREVAGKEECSLSPVWYVDLATDQWSELPPLDLPRGWCPVNAVAHQDDLYLLVGEDVSGAQDPGPDGSLPPLQLWRYQAASGGWEQLPSPSARTGWGIVHGLDDGFVRIAPTLDEGGLPLVVEYSWFDYAAATWQEGPVSDDSEAVLWSAGSNLFYPVGVDGRQLVLFVDWPLDWQAGGTATLITWDPATNQRVRQISHDISAEVMSASAGNLSFADPGFVLIGSLWTAAPSTQAALVDLRDGTWSELEVPDRSGAISQRYPGASEWAKTYFITELAGYVVANGYLYNPVTQRWLWVPSHELAPPDQEFESGDGSVEVAPSLRCDWGRPPVGCWRLDVDPLETIVGEFTAADVAQNNRR